MNPQLSIIVPVLNEAGIINQTLAQLRPLAVAGGFEVIVVDGDPRQTTLAAIAAGAGMALKTLGAAPGRGIQMNAGAAAARGRYLLFLHADTCIGQAALDAMAGLLRDAAVAGGAYDLGIRSERRIYRIIEAAVFVRSRITRIPYGDQGIFIRKAVFDRIGGFAPIALMEDVELMRRIRKYGGKMRMLPIRVSTSARRWEKEGPVRCTLRNWLLMGAYLLGCSPERLTKFYPPA